MVKIAFSIAGFIILHLFPRQECSGVTLSLSCNVKSMKKTEYGNGCGNNDHVASISEMIAINNESAENICSLLNNKVFESTQVLTQHFHNLSSNICFQRPSPHLASSCNQHLYQLPHDDSGWKAAWNNQTKEHCLKRNPCMETEPLKVLVVRVCINSKVSKDKVYEIAVTENFTLAINSGSMVNIVNTPGVMEAFHSTRIPIWKRLENDQSLFTGPFDKICEVTLSTQTELFISGLGVFMEFSQLLQTFQVSKNSLKIGNHSYLQNVFTNDFLNLKEDDNTVLKIYYSAENSDAHDVVFLLPITVLSGNASVTCGISALTIHHRTIHHKQPLDVGVVYPEMVFFFLGVVTSCVLYLTIIFLRKIICKKCIRNGRTGKNSNAYIAYMGSDISSLKTERKYSPSDRNSRSNSTATCNTTTSRRPLTPLLNHRESTDHIHDNHYHKQLNSPTHTESSFRDLLDSIVECDCEKNDDLVDDFDDHIYCDLDDVKFGQRLSGRRRSSTKSNNSGNSCRKHSRYRRISSNSSANSQPCMCRASTIPEELCRCDKSMCRCHENNATAEPRKQKISVTKMVENDIYNDPGSLSRINSIKRIADNQNCDSSESETNDKNQRSARRRRKNAVCSKCSNIVINRSGDLNTPLLERNTSNSTLSYIDETPKEDSDANLTPFSQRKTPAETTKGGSTYIDPYLAANKQKGAFESVLKEESNRTDCKTIHGDHNQSSSICLNDSQQVLETEATVENFKESKVDNVVLPLVVNNTSSSDEESD